MAKINLHPNLDREVKKGVAWAVHAFTTCGIVLGFLALVSVLKNDAVAAFMWLGLALFVDGVDGTLARKARVLEYTPNVDGRTLDNVIDFFTYVAVPALMVYWFDMTPVDFIFSGQTWSLISAAAIMAVSCYTFANVGMKSDDYYFVGFPALWNVVVLYFFVLQTGPLTNLLTIAFLCVLTFIPIKFVHPLRVAHWRGITVPMTVRVPVGGGIHAPELHSDSPEAFYAHQPGLKVVMPSGPYDAKGLLISALRDPDPVIFFEPKRIYRAIREEVPEDEYTLPIGKARTVCEGNELTIVSWGASVVQCMQAIEKSGKSIELIDLRTIYPFDIDAVEASVSKTGRCVVVHEAPLTCGFGAEISARIMERCFLHLEAPVQRVAGFDTTMPYYKLELDYLPDAHRVTRAIHDCLAY